MDIPSSLFPILSVKEGTELLHVQNFEGTGFWVTTKGHFLTCKPVVEHLQGDLKPALADPFGEHSDRYRIVRSVQAHPKYDLALCHAPSKRTKTIIQPYAGEIAMGLDLYSFGFMEPEKQGNRLSINGRLLKGHVTRMNHDPERFPAKSLMELSFPCPKGFSGAPIVVDGGLVGMVYGNIESTMQTFALTEVDEPGSSYREVAYRVLEFGMAHPLNDLVSFMQQCGISPFE